MQILVDLNGVLRGDKDQPIPQGVVMVGSLSGWNRVLLMSELDAAATKYWLDVNKIVDFDLIIDSSAGLVGDNLKERQFNRARSLGPVDLFVTNDPTMWAFAFEQGVASVMFGAPSYTRPEFRPDAPKKLRAWSDIESAIEKQNELRTNDARLSRTEALNFE